MKDKDISSLFGPITKALGRYNLTIFIVVFVGGLATAVLMLSTALQQSSDTKNYQSNTDSTSFDQATIDKIKLLRTSKEAPADITLPTGRINPFTE